MENFNPFLSSIDLKDAIYSKVQKSKAILTCIMFATEFVRSDVELDNASLYNALWAVDDYLGEISLLFEQLEKSKLLQ